MTDPSTSIRCPACQAEVRVTLPGRAEAGSCWRGWRCPLVVGGLAVVGGLCVAYRYRGQLWTVWNLVNEATGSAALSGAILCGGAFLALCLVGWLLLPLGMGLAYLDLRRRVRPACPCAALAPALRVGPCTEPAPAPAPVPPVVPPHAPS